MVLPRRLLLRIIAGGLWLLTGAAVWPGAAVAQSPGPLTPDDISPHGQVQGSSSPTYAESAQGSPYGEVYSRTFGASGEPAEPSRGTAPNAAPGPSPTETAGEVVYVIDSNGLLTFRAEDYGPGQAAPIGHNPQPLMQAPNAVPRTPAQVPTVADSLYLQPPLATAAGPRSAQPASPAPAPVLPGSGGPQ